MMLYYEALSCKSSTLQISIYFRRLISVLFGHSKPLPEILLHEGEAIPQLDFWLPSQQFCSLCDVRFPLSWIVRSIVHLLYLDLRIYKLQKHRVSINDHFFFPKTIVKKKSEKALKNVLKTSHKLPDFPKSEFTLNMISFPSKLVGEFSIRSI